MEFVEILNEGLKRGYRLSISGTEVSERVDRKLDELRPNAQRRGFRPGKVPINLLKAQYGEELRNEVVGESVKTRLDSHLEECGDKLVTQPVIDTADKPQDDGGFQCEITYELRPTIPELNFIEFEFAKPVLDSLDAATEGYLEKIALSRATHEAAGEGYAACDGDKVWADISGLCDGEPYEGGESEYVDFIVDSNAGEKQFQALAVGATVGQVLKTTQRVAGDEQLGEASDRIGVLSATVESIERAIPPEINDALAVEMGFADLQELTDMARERAFNENEIVSNDIVRRRLFDKLDALLEFELPPTALSSETESVRRVLEYEQREKSALGEAASPGESGDGDIAAESERIAARRLRLGFFMKETAARHDLPHEFTDDDLVLFSMEGSTNPNFRYMTEVRLKNDPVFRQRLASQLVDRKALDYILSLATVSDEPVSQDQLTALHAELYLE